MTSKTKTSRRQQGITRTAVSQAEQSIQTVQDDLRRYVRLEISAPMTVEKIRDLGGQFWPNGSHQMIGGLILNISAGGVLVEVNQPLAEGDIVAMRFTIEGVEEIDHILGLVKRVDHEDGVSLAGIEFVTREQLVDLFSRAELEVLASHFVGFDESIRSVLNRHIKRERKGQCT